MEREWIECEKEAKCSQCARDLDETNTGVLPEIGMKSFFLKKNQI